MTKFVRLKIKVTNFIRDGSGQNKSEKSFMTKFLHQPDTKHDGKLRLAMVLYLLEVLAAAAEKSLFCSRVILEPSLVVVVNVAGLNSLEVGADGCEEAADNVRADFRPTTLDIRRPAHPDAMRPPAAEASDPLLSRAVVFPPLT